MTTPESTGNTVWYLIKAAIALTVIAGVLVAANRSHGKSLAATDAAPPVVTQNDQPNEPNADVSMAREEPKPIRAEPRFMHATVTRPGVPETRADDGNGAQQPPPAEPDDGKVYVTSDPAGAEIFIEHRNHESETTGKVTPALVSTPRRCTLVLRLAGFNDAKMPINAVDDSIQKPAAVVLEKTLYAIDIVAKHADGFAVYIDKTPATDKSGGQAQAPCTVSLTGGAHEIDLVKDGFRDITLAYTVEGKSELKFDEEPVAGVSKLVHAKAPVDTPSTIKAPAREVDLARKLAQKLSKPIAQDTIVFLTFSREYVKTENDKTQITNLGTDGGMAVGTGGKLVDGGWKLNGNGEFISFTPTTKKVKERTFSAWVQLADVNQSGAGVVSIHEGEVFDSLVYNEQQKGWMFGSDYFRRTSNSNVRESKPEWIHIAITYADKAFTLYRNGKKIATEARFPCMEFNAPIEMLVGLRHPGASNGFLNGTVSNIAVISRCLSEAEVQTLYRAGH